MSLQAVIFEPTSLLCFFALLQIQDNELEILSTETDLSLDDQVWAIM